MRGDRRTPDAASEKRGAPAAKRGRSRALTALLSRFRLDRDRLDADVLQAFAALAAEADAREERLENAELRVAELERLADADSLPGVLNRRAFMRELQRVLAMAERHGAKAALLFADLDGLKKINDAKGHIAGDAALAHVARIILANTRRTDAVGRLGGDEFGVILAESDVAAARKKAAALADLAAAEPVGEADGWRGAPFAARLSCGVVEIRKGASVEETLALADSAMYRVKKAR
jgi:diguanylate cyclase (GGDEF)-like protein